VQSRFEVRRRVRYRVQDELERRREPDADLLADLGAQHALRALERGGRSGACFVVAEHGVEHRRVLQVAGHPRVRHRDEAEPRVLDPGVQHLGHDLLDPVCQLARPWMVRHVFSPSLCQPLACSR